MDNTKFIKGDFKLTGTNEVNIENVINKWNHLWSISEWKFDNSWTLVKNLRKDSSIIEFKVKISTECALELCSKLKLIPIPSSIFRSGVTWRKYRDYYNLEEYREKRYLSKINQE
jgi:hypothetical protein